MHNLMGNHICFSLGGVFTNSAPSPPQARLLFSFMKINETVHPAAEASGAAPDSGGPSGFVTLFLHVVVAVQREPARTPQSGTAVE